MGIRGAGVFVLTLVWCGIAAAQPAVDQPENTPPLVDDVTQPAPPPTNATDVANAYDAAFRALVDGNFDAAISGFDNVAVRAADDEVRAASRELARLARRLKGKRIAFVSADATHSPIQIVAIPRPMVPDDEPSAGRVQFISTTTAASFYSGFVLLALLEVDDFRAGSLVVTGATAAGFVGSLFGSRGQTITAGMADAYTLGLGIGVANGLLISTPLGLDSSKQILSMGLGGLVVGGASSLFLAEHARPTVGQASFTGTLAVMGWATAGLGLIVIDPDIEPDTALLMLAGGIDVGAAVGIGLSQDLQWSKSRARLVALSAFLGGLGGFAGSAIVVGEPSGDDELRVMAGSVLAGAWGGLALGVHLTRDMKVDPRFLLDDTPSHTAMMIMPYRTNETTGLTVGGQF